MDYGELLYKAHENNKNAFNKEVRCYKTTFSPPKKLERNVSSDNIKKFLARREDEERKRAEEARRRKEELLALRSQDKKATRRVQTMLRATKSANKSVMEDAVDNINTRDTLNGFKQCDEDDYGYVSQEASAFYNKLLNKYEKMPPEPPKFQPAPKKEVKDLKSAVERVKASLQKEAEEEMQPHKRKKRKHSDKDNEEPSEKNEEEIEEPKNSGENKEKKVHKHKSKKPPPPPMNFDQLLQIAQKKQFEPIMIDESLLKKEPERLMTKKEKMEAERMASCRKGKVSKTAESLSSNKSDVSSKEDNEKKLAKNSEKTESLKTKKPDADRPSGSRNETIKSEKKVSFSTPLSSGDKILGSKEATERLKKDSSVWSKSLNSPSNGMKTKPSALLSKPSTSTNPKMKNDSQNLPRIEKKPASEFKKTDSKAPIPGEKKVNELEKEIQKMKAQQELLMRQLKEKELAMKKMEDLKKKEPSLKLPKREPEKKLVKKPLPEKKKIPVTNKRRIDSESEEYDSELDDFIDDGPDEGNDYSKYISEIFGYDKSKYANHAEDEDDECMESNFAQISKEEYVSTKIGIMEDLEDIRKEQEEKRRLKERKLRKLEEARRKKLKH